MSINRRYVVGLDANGVSDILLDDDWSALTPIMPGLLEAREVWVNDETPADLTSDTDNGDQPIRHEPPDGGAVFRVLTFHPTGKTELTDQVALQVHELLKSDNLPTQQELAAAKDPSMHKTDTLNYFFVASGEMWMLTEGRDVKVRQGDLIVQKGCMHGWRNDGTEPCTLVAVLIDAIPLR